MRRWHRRCGTDNVNACHNWTRPLLATLLVAVALNAFAGGYYGLAGAKGVPIEWLAGSPFHSYAIPSLVLFIVVGGSCLSAAVVLLLRSRLERTAVLTSGLVLLVWIVAQVIIIGFVSWLQPTIFTIAIVVVALATRLP